MARTDTSTTIDGYVDIYLLPIPARNVAAYKEQATLFGTIARQYGALRYRELRGDDLGDSLRVGGRLEWSPPAGDSGGGD